jgi:hypothetical protein
MKALLWRSIKLLILMRPVRFALPGSGVAVVSNGSL